MATIIKFKANYIGGFKEDYRCDSVGDFSGEYVPLAEYAALTAERDGLRAVYQEVVDFIETEEWTSMGTGELTPYERKVTALAEKLRRALGGSDVAEG